MTVNPEQNYTVAATVFEGLEWRGDRRSASNKRYIPARPDQHTTITEPVQVVETAFGVYPGELPEADAQLEALTSLKKSLEANIGQVMLLQSPGWEDGAQGRTRLFSPMPNASGEVPEFKIKTATRKSGGFRGWLTTMRLPGLADVYDIWYEDTDVRPTEIGYPLYKTHRVNGSMSLTTEILNPVDDIKLVTDPEEICEITEAQHPGYGDNLIEMMQDAIVELQKRPA